MKTSVEWNDEGVKLYQAKKFEDALSAILMALQLDNSNPIFWKNLGDCHYDMGNVQEALRSYEKAIQIGKNQYPSMILDFALILNSEKQYQKSLNYLMQVEKNPKLDVVEQKNLINTIIDDYIHLNEFSQALRYLNKLQSQWPKEGLSSKNCVQSLKISLGLKEFKKFFADLKKFMSIFPDDKEILLYLISVFDEYHLYGSILNYFETFLLKHPEDLEIRSHYLLIRCKYEDYCELNKRIAEQLTIATNHEYRDFLQNLQRKTNEDIEKLNYSKADPPPKDLSQHDSFYLHRVICCLLKRDFSTGLFFLQKYLQIQKNSKAGILLYGIFKVFTKDYSKSSKILEILIEEDPSIIATHLALAYCYFQLHEISKMEYSWQKLCEIAPIFLNFENIPDYFSKILFQDDLFGLTLFYVQNLI